MQRIEYVSPRSQKSKSCQLAIMTELPTASLICCYLQLMEACGCVLLDRRWSVHGQKENTSDLTVITSCDIVYSVVAGKTFNGNLYFFLLLLMYNGLFPALAVAENSVSPKKAVHFKSNQYVFVNCSLRMVPLLAALTCSKVIQSNQRNKSRALFMGVISGDSHSCNALALNMGTEGWKGIRFIK